MNPLVFALAFTLGLLLAGLVFGTLLEHRHFQSIRRREEDARRLPTLSFVPEDWAGEDPTLVQGSAVVSLDYFKRFLSSWRAIFGGRMRSLEPLLERGRREALLRMKAEALRDGHDAIVNVRLATSRLANAKGDMKGTAGIEVLAYGTAIRRR